MTNFALLYPTTIFCFYKNKKNALDHEGWVVGVAALWGHHQKVLTLKTAIYLLSVIQTLLQTIADERNPFGGLPRHPSVHD